MSRVMSPGLMKSISVMMKLKAVTTLETLKSVQEKRRVTQSYTVDHLSHTIQNVLACDIIYFLSDGFLYTQTLVKEEHALLERYTHLMIIILTCPFQSL